MGRSRYSGTKGVSAAISAESILWSDGLFEFQTAFGSPNRTGLHLKRAKFPNSKWRSGCSHVISKSLNFLRPKSPPSHPGLSSPPHINTDSSFTIMSNSLPTPSVEEIEDVILMCRYGELEEITAFVEKYGAKYVGEARDEGGNTVLHMCCGNGHAGG